MLVIKHAYWTGLFAFDSPWYQRNAVGFNGSSGASIAFHNVESIVGWVECGPSFGEKSITRREEKDATSSSSSLSAVEAPHFAIAAGVIHG